MAADKQRQLQRVLDRVEQLPILPGSTLDPGQVHGVDVDLPLIAPTPRCQPADAAEAVAADHMQSHCRSAAAPWLLALAPAMSAIVAAIVATATTLYLAHREPSLRGNWAALEQPVAKDRLVAPTRKRRENSRPHVASAPAGPPAHASESTQVDGRPTDRTPRVPYISPTTEFGNALAPRQASRDDESRPLPSKLQAPDREALKVRARHTRTGKLRASIVAAGRRRKGEPWRGIAAAAAQKGSLNAVQPRLRPRTVGASDVLAGGL